LPAAIPNAAANPKSEFPNPKLFWQIVGKISNCSQMRFTAKALIAALRRCGG
jgi:hypothetical protein